MALGTAQVPNPIATVTADPAQAARSRKLAAQLSAEDGAATLAARSSPSCTCACVFPFKRSAVRSLESSASPVRVRRDLMGVALLSE